MLSRRVVYVALTGSLVLFLIRITQTEDPHNQLILFKLLLMYGRTHPNLLRSAKKWHPLIPLLMELVLVPFDRETEDYYAGSVSATGWQRTLVVPIEARLRMLAVGILYEVLRVQKLSASELGRCLYEFRIPIADDATEIFDDGFIDHLFQLVEDTRDMQDETLNYSVIKLIVRLNFPRRASVLADGNIGLGRSERTIHGRFPST